MSIVEVKVPQLSESVAEATLLQQKALLDQAFGKLKGFVLSK